MTVHLVDVELALIFRRWSDRSIELVVRALIGVGDYNEDVRACLATVSLTGAQFARHRMGFGLPADEENDMPCAEALLALWLGLDREEALENENTVDLRCKT